MRKKWVVCMIACLTILLTGCNGNTAKETARNDTDKRISSTAGNTETTTETEKADDACFIQYRSRYHFNHYDIIGIWNTESDDAPIRNGNNH